MVLFGSGAHVCELCYVKLKVEGTGVKPRVRRHFLYTDTLTYNRQTLIDIIMSSVCARLCHCEVNLTVTKSYDRNAQLNHFSSSSHVRYLHHLVHSYPLYDRPVVVDVQYVYGDVGAVKETRRLVDVHTDEQREDSRRRLSGLVVEWPQCVKFTADAVQLKLP